MRWRSARSFIIREDICDMSGEIHGGMKDAGDFNVPITKAIKDGVATGKTNAAIGMKVGTDPPAGGPFGDPLKGRP